MEINGKKVVDATKSITIHITKNDTVAGATKDPATCAAARAARRDVPECISARVHIGRVYVETPKHWIRYDTPHALRTEIIAFDRGGSFEPGDYRLLIPDRRIRADDRTGRPHGSDSSASKKRHKVLIAKVKRHEVTGIRPKGANR